MTLIYNPTTVLARRAALQYAYMGFQLRYTGAIRSLVWARGGGDSYAEMRKT